MAEILQTAANVLRVSLNGTWGGNRQMTNVQHWLFDSDPSISEVEATLEVILIAWQDIILDGVPPNYEFTGSNWLVLTSENSPSGIASPVAGHPTAGAGLGAPLPANCSVLVHKESASSGRKAKNGRLYLPPGDEAAVGVDGVIQSGPLSALQTMVDSYFNAIDAIPLANPAQYCQPHWYKTNKPDDETGGIWPSSGVSLVTGLRVDPIIATQRRRMR